MDRAIATQLLQQELARVRQAGYDALLRTVEAGPLPKDVVGPDGKTYQLETSAFWDDKENGPIRVIVAIDDGGWRAFIPMTADEIIAPPE
jgi:hypothetical protein